MTRETLDLDEVEMPELVERRRAAEEKPFLPYGVTGNQQVPDFLPIGGSRLVRQTSSTHGADGYITTDPQEIAAMQDRLAAKLNKNVSEFTYYDETAVPGADTLVIAYGVTARAAGSAVKKLQQRGTPVSLLVLKTLWPVPAQLIRDQAAPFQRVLMVEMNLGQYVREIQRLLPDKKVDFLGQMNGELVKPGQIMERIQHG